MAVKVSEYAMSAVAPGKDVVAILSGGGGGTVTVTVAIADFVVSATLFAVTVAVLVAVTAGAE